MEDDNANFGTPANGASPGSNPILAQPPLSEANASEGMSFFCPCLPIN